MRADYCWENDVENIPIFLFLSLGYALLGADPTWVGGIMAVFCVSRVAHAYCLLRALQPARTIAYCVGIVCGVIAGVGIVRLALAS